MPSPRKIDHVIFIPLVVLTLIVWTIYRSLFKFPVWFDETLGKAVFFGFPVWLYLAVTRCKPIIDSFSLAKFRPGVLLGLAFGGMYGFAAAITMLMIRGGHVQAAALFSSNIFWWQFFLAMMTAFWETLFFFSFIMVVIQLLHRRWSLMQQALVSAGIFLIFHVPNIFIRFDNTEIMFQIVLLFLFGAGQALLFARRQNAYALVMSHAIWGMVLLIHVR